MITTVRFNDLWRCSDGLVSRQGWIADKSNRENVLRSASATFNWETVEEVKLREKGMDIYSNQEKVGITIWGWQLIVMGFFLGIGIELGILLIKYLTAS